MTKQFYSYVSAQEKWKHMSIYLYTNVYSSIIHNGQKVETVHMFTNPTGKCINKMWHSHVIEYYSAIQRMNYQHMLQHE